MVCAMAIAIFKNEVILVQVYAFQDLATLSTYNDNILVVEGREN
jgi:hypothetical protein